MDHSKTPLPVIVNVTQPCPMSWDAMPSAEAGRRFCAHCQRHVHDLSSMRRDEVADLVCRSAGNLCVRFEPLPGGGVKTLDYQPLTGREGRTRRWLMVGAIVSLMGGVANAMWHKRQPPPAPVVLGGIGPPPMVIGGPCPPTLTTSPPATTP
jgi:hypothetical protein